MFLSSLTRVFGEDTEGSSSRRGLGGSAGVLGMGVVRVGLVVARAKGYWAEWGRGSEVGAVMGVKVGVQILVGRVT